VLGKKHTTAVLNKARRAPARRALTLMELIAVAAVLGLLAAMALPYFGHATLANVGARGFARRLALDELHAQRRAISTGDNHYLAFTKNGANVTDYALYRRQGGADVRIDEIRSVPADVQVTTNVDDFEFTFTGTALAAYTANIQSSEQQFVVAVIAATGKTTVSEL
jgi:prepilin-type N-terminal cleavage/methylation domain-containing protein